MRIFTFVLVLLAHYSSLAQNWAPINSTEQFNYRLGDADVTTHSLKVDSVLVNEEDSVMYLNRVIAPCDSCIDSEIEYTLNSINFFNEGGLTWERNQPQFLGLKVITDGEDWVFSNSIANFTIKPNEPLLNPWQFSEGIEAFITEETEQLVFGELDSIKFIYLSGGQIIQLSKNHGLLSFPNLEGDGEFNLQGIEERELGEVLPDFHSVFNFEVGDVFLRHHFSNNETDSPGSPVYSGHKVSGIEKEEITEIVFYDDSVNVTYNTLTNDTIWLSEYSPILNEDVWPIATLISYNIGSSIQNVTYTREEYELLNRIPLSSDNSSMSFQYQMSEDERLIQYNNGYCYIDEDYSSSNYFMKAYDINFSFEEGYIISGNEQLLQEYMYSLFWSPEVDFDSKAYSDGIGNISSSGNSYDPGYNNGSEITPDRSSSHKSRLLAFEKSNGETGGVMLTDSEILTVSEQLELNLTIYPNPAQNFIHISGDQNLNFISVKSILGKEVLNHKASGKEVSIEFDQLASGTYILEVSTIDGDRYTQRIIKEY